VATSSSRTPPSPQTLFKNIYSLPSGHFLVVKNGDVSVREYWDLNYPLAADATDGKPETHYAETLRDRLEQSVRYRLQADVPVGFFLSSGLDSSLIAAMIRRVSPDVQRHSFSISFSDERLCEAKYQRLVSDSVASIHHEIPFHDSDIALGLRDAVYHSECSLKETYNTASVALSRTTRQTGVTVVLNGEGSDELFAGYRFDKGRNGNGKSQDLETILGDEIREKFWAASTQQFRISSIKLRAALATLSRSIMARGASLIVSCKRTSNASHECWRSSVPVRARSSVSSSAIRST
jgi:asparagine synthase (glutamine-hydrolysing)